MYQLKKWLEQMFAYPRLRLDREDYDSYWRDKRGENIGAISDWQQERADFVIENLESGASICDVACGDGSILHYVKSQKEVGELIGTDISEFALKRAKEFGVRTIKLDIADKKQLSNIPEADYILLFEILEHVPHSEELLKAAFSRARKGVFFSFPNTGFFVHRLRLFFGRFPMQWLLFPGEHVRFWTKRDLLWWLKSLGYRNYRVKYYKGVPFFNQLMPSWFAAGFVVFVPSRSVNHQTIPKPANS